jgi:transposase
MSIDSSYELPPGRPQRVEVITSVERRRRWSPGEKKQMVDETYTPGWSVSSVARKHGIAPSQLFSWKRKMEAGALTAVGSEEELVPASELKRALDRAKRLEQLIGRLTEENDVLKEAVKIGREKKLISRKPLEGVRDFE